MPLWKKLLEIWLEHEGLRLLVVLIDGYECVCIKQSIYCLFTQEAAGNNSRMLGKILTVEGYPAAP